MGSAGPSAGFWISIDQRDPAKTAAVKIPANRKTVTQGVFSSNPADRIKLRTNPTERMAKSWSIPIVDQRSFTLEPYANFGGHDDQVLVAELNVRLAEEQRSGAFEQRVANCFGRRFDQSLTRLIDINKRTPLGDPAAA